MKQTQLAYFAGLFDGEGSFSIQVGSRDYKGRPSVRFNPRLTMTLRYGTEVLAELRDCFGGQLYSYPDSNVRWNCSTKSGAIAAAEAMLPYLRIKKEIAINFLKALSMFPEDRKAHGAGERSWDRERTLAVAKIALNLNTSHKSPKTDLYLKELAEIYDK